MAPDNEKLIDSEKFADNEQQKHEDQGDALLGRRRVAQKAISAHANHASESGELATPEERFEVLKDMVAGYASEEDLALLEKAYRFAEKAHKGQCRKSGEPFIAHPVEVAIILADLRMDVETLCAALLHDTVEDAGVTKEQLEKMFGPRVTELVLAETEDKHREMSAAASWKMRKEESIRDLRSTNDSGVKAMWLSDKLSNLRSLYEDWRKKGSAVWQIFNQKDPA